MVLGSNKVIRHQRPPLDIRVDSGSISCIAAKHNRDLKIFTIGFDLHSASGIELGFDERVTSEYLSYLYKTEHYEMVLKSGDMERCLPKFVWHLEEPSRIVE